MDTSEKSLPATGKRGGLRPWHIALIVVLILLLIGGGILASKWRTIDSLLTGTHYVGGDAATVPLTLPPGFHASAFYSGLSGPRMITFSPDGTLFVAERYAKSIIALPDRDHSGKASERIVVVSGLDDPTSLDFHAGQLYVGEGSRVTRFTLDKDYKVTERKVIVPNLPVGGNHSTRTVLIGHDNYLYVSIGSTCNNCVEQNPQRATVWRYNLDGSNGRLYAKGLRNAVGMSINPWNQQIWVTNNGRDLLGDNIPHETVYHLVDGANYGWPFCHAGDNIDPDLGKPDSCKGVTQPLVRMQAHSAPLGLAFYNAQQQGQSIQGAKAFPQQYQGLFVAFHGSWNRSVPTGYKVVFIPLTAHGQVAGKAQDFATGWLKGNDASGRPVGLAVGPDHALYVSDDKDGTIYRIWYTG